MGKKEKSKTKVQYQIQDQTIIFSNNFDEPIDEYHAIINKCQCMKFANGSLSKFNHPIIIPMNLTSIIFPCMFNKPIVLTPNLTSVKFDNPYSSSFNSSIEPSKKLKYLNLGYYFDNPISLTKYLMHFSLITNFYKHDLVLNKYLKKLVLGVFINFENRCVLPKILYELTLCEDTVFDLKLSKNMYSFTINMGKLNKCLQLPKNIRRIDISCKSTHPFILTPRVTYLYLCLGGKNLENKFILERPVDLLELSEFTPYICENLHNGTKCIEFCHYHGFSACNLPNSLSIIIFRHCNDDYDDDFDLDDEIKRLNIPENIIVEITYDWNL